jgi:glycosyltransferase involved in cell wall biosynthesis
LETVVDGETGLLVEPANPRVLADAINRLLRDRALAKNLGQNGRRRVETVFSWASIAETTERLYQEVVEEKRSWRT